MWCTRWFLPLLLLPLPTASPYFLFLFFFSLTLHARPCFYCIILLTALFTSSCYWQPIPTRALFEAAFPNVSSSSPLLYLPNSSVSDEGTIQASQLLPVPKLTALSDRCWCDLSAGHLFDPYNMTLWQMTSLSRTLDAMKSQRVLVAQEAQLPSKSDLELPGNSSETRRMAKVWVLRLMGTDESRSDRQEGEGEGGSLSSSTDTPGMWSWSFSFLLRPFQSSLLFPFRDGQPLDNSSQVSSTVKPVTRIEMARLPLLRRTYDLRPHGIDLVIDLGWGRSYT